ncbi:uncharacterized protein LOC122510528 isoform X1 [Leptopilina heterotoma]|uniref:uncharacterized protein LOC122510528 isoform X1 n=1 Tax=Leptopilina heterotoma TaxID=63436 RepID=UPI001CA958B8|nr:uncharacterized protein LOC122510528 isoform X1 [Leptopilina heterotoma]
MENSKSSEGSERNVSSSSTDSSSSNQSADNAEKSSTTKPVREDSQEPELENMMLRIKELELQNSIQQSTIEILYRTQNLKTPSFFDNMLPVTTEENLEELTKLLKTNDSLKKEFSESLVLEIDRENVLSRSITYVMKKILSKDVANLFNLKCQMGNKKVFKGTPLYEFIYEFVTAYCQKKFVVFSDKEFDQELTKVLTRIQR